MKLTLADLDAESPDDLEPFELELDDKTTVLIPHPMDVRAEVLLDYDPASPESMLRAVLSDEDWETVITWPGMTLRRIGVVFDAYSKHFGLSLGKAPGSPRSSTGTAKRSRPTSRGKAGR